MQTSHWSGRQVTVFAGIGIGKLALKGICHVLAAGHELMTPGVAFAIETAR